MVNTRAGRASIPLGRFDDEQLAALVREGHTEAFEVLLRRHQVALAGYCRHLLGSREDGEDALQETLVRAHRALRCAGPPRAVRPWLFAIARNRCLTVLAARREPVVPLTNATPSPDDVADRVRLRIDLDEVLGDLATLPRDQRRALVLAELGDLSQAEVAHAIGCRPGKVKALVFQARAGLIAERDARAIPCAEIRRLLATVTGGALRRGPLRRHLRACPACRTHRPSDPRRRSLVLAPI
jgi:RNA polymerase sigma factor (sigma-70 family)